MTTIRTRVTWSKSRRTMWPRWFANTTAFLAIAVIVFLGRPSKAEIKSDLSVSVKSYVDRAAKWGKIHASKLEIELQNPDNSFEIWANRNYDQIYVMYQLSKLVDTNWFDLAREEAQVYSRWLTEGHHGVQGYSNYNGGVSALAAEPRVSAEDRALFSKASGNLAMLSAYSGPYVLEPSFSQWTDQTNRSREVALSVASHLNARTIGAEHSDDVIRHYAKQMLGHVDEWNTHFGPKTSLNWAPFMMGLTSRSLIMYHDAMASQAEQGQILSELTELSETMWDKAWVKEDQAFFYRPLASGEMKGAPDLNLLVAPLYGWLYHETGENEFAERFDQIFAGGVKSAWLGGAKQFNQNYLWSLDGLRWRGIDLLADKRVGALQPGDANLDSRFDQFDLVQVQVRGKYLTGQPASWGDGDWNGGVLGTPAGGDGLFNQRDIVAALAYGDYSPASSPPPRAAKPSPPLDVAGATADIDRPEAFAALKASNSHVFSTAVGGGVAPLPVDAVSPSGRVQPLTVENPSAFGSVELVNELVDLNHAAVPEPSMLALISIGMFCLVGWAHRIY